MNQALDPGNMNMMPAHNQSMTASAGTDMNKGIAEIQSAMTIAKRFPRNEMQAIERIKNSFGRLTLAENSQYQYSKGGSSVSGPSIRSAEAIAQMWGNVEFGFREISRGIGPDGIGFSEVQAYAWDIESNTKRPATFVVRHWRDTKGGGYPLKDEREIYELMANMAQRRVRACIISVIPGDVFDEAMKAATETLKSKVDISQEGIKKMVDAFQSNFGVTKEQIEARIQRNIQTIQPGQMVQLKRIYASLRDGMGEVADWFGRTEQSAATESSAPDTGRQELPTMNEDTFSTQAEGWYEMIVAGKKTADEIIATVSTRFALTDEQIARIRKLEGDGNNEEG